MKSVTIKGEKREGFGTKASKAVRKEGKIPCVVYGGDGQLIHFVTTPKAVKSLIYTPDFKMAIIELDGSDEIRAILKDVQFHPVSEQVLHIDFLKLVPEHTVKVDIPVRFKGSSQGVKAGGTLQQNLRRVRVKTTPENLVGELFADVSSLEMGQSVRVRDIELAKGMEMMTPGATPIATVEVPRALRSASAAAEGEEGAEVGEATEEEAPAAE
jgi:large subunit ribosomal protein L25